MTQQKFSHWLNLVVLLIKRELKIRYRGSFLGYLWSMLNPLLMMVVLSVVFSHAFSRTENYPIYILSGIICWNIFSQSALNGVGIIVGNASLMKKVKVPSWVFPTAAIGSAFIHMLFAIPPFFAIALYLGVTPSASVVQLPFIVSLYFFFILGFVLVISSLNVFFRDVAHVLEPIIQIGFYGAPILYPMSILPEKYIWLVKLNPFYYYLEGFRASLYSPVWLGPMAWGVMVGLTFISVSFGLLVHKKSEDRFLYYL